MKKLILIIMAIFMLPMTVQGANITDNLENTTIQPDSEARVNGNVTLGENTSQSNLTVDYPYNYTLYGNNDTAYVNASTGSTPGSYLLEVTDDGGDTAHANITVPNTYEWGIGAVQTQNNLSVGHSGSFGHIEVKNKLETSQDFTISSSGNLSEYLTHQSGLYISSDFNVEVGLGYQVPRDTDFGNYQANITISGEKTNRSLSVNTTFLDEIEPEVEKTDFPDYMATKPKNFTVTASDNLEVTNVTAEVIHEVEEEQNNETVTVNETYTTLQFEPQENSDDWVVNPAIDEIDSYYIQGSACDESDNCVAFNSTFDVNGLDVIKVDENVEVPKYKVDSDHSYKIGEIQSATPLNISLDTFSKDLENSSFEVGITHGGSTQKFFADDKLVSLEDSGDISIYVYSDEVGRFSGVLAYEPIPQHLSVPNSEFSGEFVNYTPPKDESFDLAGKHYDCQALASEVASEAYWDCSFKVYAENVQNSLTEDMKTVIPRDYEQNFIDQKEEEVEEALSKASRNMYFGVGGIVLAVLMVFGVLYYLSVQDAITLKQDDTERRFG